LFESITGSSKLEQDIEVTVDDFEHNYIAGI
jgi:hypothetical protein